MEIEAKLKVNNYSILFGISCLLAGITEDNVKTKIILYSFY